MNKLQLNEHIRQLINENYQVLKVEPTTKYLKILQDWLNTLSFEGRSPKGMKKEHQSLKGLQGHINGIKKYYNNIPTEENVQQIGAIMSWWKTTDIDNINIKFKKREDEIRIINLSNAIFHNKSIISQKRFIQTSKNINNFLSTLKGIHKKILTPKINIYFVKKTDSKAKATYKSEKDIIYIRPDLVKSGDHYGSFNYILVHELGHRYENKFKVPQDIYHSSKWYTTDYSKSTNSWTGEQFAELFALSHWYNIYSKKYKRQLDDFKEIL